MGAVPCNRVNEPQKYFRHVLSSCEGKANSFKTKILDMRTDSVLALNV